MMNRAYDESYLSETMTCLGAMLDYAVNSCGEDINLFYARFLSSGIAAQIGRGNPRYLCGHSGVEMAIDIADRTGCKLNNASPMVDMGSPEYWTGWTLAYLQWFFALDFKALQKAGIDAETVILRYSTLHEADISKSVSFADKAIKGHRSQDNPLKRLRRNVHLTQKRLASLSGISLRAIRAYEQSQTSLANASADSLVRLSKAIGCTPADLLS